MVATVLIGALVAGAVLGRLGSRLAFAVPTADVAIATLVTLTSLALAVLFVARHRRSARTSDAVLAVAFAASAPLEGSLALAPDLDWTTPTVAFWGRSAGRVLVAVALLGAAWLPRRPSRTPYRAPTIAAASVTVALVVLAFTILWEPDLPTAVHGVTDDSSPLLHESWALAVWRLFPAALLAVAAIGFARENARERDRLIGWLAVATALMATSRYFSFLFPALHVDWVTLGELVRALAQVVLLVGILSVLVENWERRVVQAAIEERRRLARELHDGLAQELAYLSTQSTLAARKGPSEERLRNLADSAERALQETRLAIVELSDDELSLDHLLRELAREAGARHGCTVEVEAVPMEVPERVGRDLVRIAGEAMANAIRHGDADRILLRLQQMDGSIHLSVTDDGRGFDAELAHTGFGLASMRARAERLGGECSIVSALDQGTSVIAEVPADG
jgi:signal transduction histidine kinase